MPDKSFARPIPHGDGASRTAHAYQFASDEFRPRGKHLSNQTGYDLEAAIFKRESFGVAFNKAGIEPFRVGTRLRSPHDIGRSVDAGDVYTVACRP